MIKFRIFSTEIRIGFSFFMFMALIFMMNNLRSIMMFFLACAVHEAGHLTAMCILGAESRCIIISGLGIRIVQSRDNMISCFRTIIILLSGVIVNFLIFVSGFFESEFSEINLILFLFNMLPFRNLDGGSILLCIGEILKREYESEILLRILAIVISVIIFLLVYIYGQTAIPAGAVILYYCFSELIKQDI